MKLAVIEAWHEAVNAGDADRVVELSAPDVEIRGPRGSAYGHAVLREWAGGVDVAEALADARLGLADEVPAR